MQQDEVSPRGRELWRALIGGDGVGRQITNDLARLSDEDVRLLASELQRLWSTVNAEAQRRDERA